MVIAPLEGELEWIARGDVKEISSEYVGFAECMMEYDYFIEHVFVNYLFTHSGYVRDRKRADECIGAMLLQATLTRMTLFCAWHSGKERFGEREILLVTAFFARMIEHGMEGMLDFIRENEDNPWFSDAGFVMLLQ